MKKGERGVNYGELADEIKTKLSPMFGNLFPVKVSAMPVDFGMDTEIEATLAFTVKIRAEDPTVFLAKKWQDHAVLEMARILWRETGKVSGAEAVKQLLSPMTMINIRRRMPMFGPPGELETLLLDIHNALYEFPLKPAPVAVGSPADA